MVSFLKGFLFGTFAGIIILFVTNSITPQLQTTDNEYGSLNPGNTSQSNNNTLSQTDAATYKSDQELLEEVLENLNNLLASFDESKFVADEHGYRGEKNEYGERDGVGILKSQTGTHFGEWKKNVRHGLGRSASRSKKDSPKEDIYTGEWKLDNQHGKGVLISAEGDKYEGDWKAGTQDGYGIYYWHDGSRYKGRWRAGNPHGRGTWDNDELKYVGHWKEGLKHGKGVLSKKIDGEVLFDGLWENDKPQK